MRPTAKPIATGEPVIVSAIGRASASKASAREHERQKKGGARRGADQTKQVAEAMRPYRKLYLAKISSGLKPTTAVRAVNHQMARDGFTHPITKKFPSDRTIKDWLQK